MTIYLYCKWCGERASYSPLLDDWWCAECRSEDIYELEEEGAEA